MKYHVNIKKLISHSISPLAIFWDLTDHSWALILSSAELLLMFLLKKAKRKKKDVWTGVFLLLPNGATGSAFHPYRQPSNSDLQSLLDKAKRSALTLVFSWLKSHHCEWKDQVHVSMDVSISLHLHFTHILCINARNVFWLFILQSTFLGECD